MSGQGQAVLVIDELGERLGIGLVADMPGHEPGEPGEARSRTRIGHFLKAQIERVGQNRGEQQRAILVLFAGLEMGKHAAEVRPLVDFEQQIGDLDARQEMIGLISQRLSAVRSVVLDRRNLEPPLGDLDVGEFAGGREFVGDVEFLAQEREAIVQVRLRRRRDG